MISTEFTLPSQDGKTTLHGRLWRPETTPVALLQISHGVAEHIGRYEPLAKLLTAHGILVAGNDHLGHGGSVAPGAPRLYLGPKGSWNTVVQDLEQVRLFLTRTCPGVPNFLLGHSMGSFLARTYLIRYPGRVRGAILMGTGQPSTLLLTAGRSMVRREIQKYGEEHASPAVSQLTFDHYNRRFAPNRTDCDWVSSDPKQVDLYRADPLCSGNASLGLFREMLDGLDFIRRPENLRRMDRKTPILFLSGSMDPVGDSGKGVQKAYDSFRRAGVADVRQKLYAGARHEILNDTCRDAVQQDLLRWITAHLPSGTAPAKAP